MISAGGDGAVRLWNPAIANDPGRDLGHHDTVWALAVTPDSSVISAGGDGAIRLWNPAIADDPGQQLALHDGGVQALAVTADARVIIATAAGLTVCRMTSA